MVSQDTYLFHGTVRRNLALARPEATADQLEAAARAAQAHDFIAALPDGYDTVVGERGLKLSGGERQRIAIARALLKDAPILVLDEATSAVDAANEAAIQHALDTLSGGRTTLMIAHRLSTVQGADRVIVMADGRIQEAGPPRRTAGRPRRLRPPGRRPERSHPMTATTVVLNRPGGSRFRPLLALLGPHRPLLLTAIISGIAHHLVVLASAGVGAWVVSRAITGATPGDLRGGLTVLGLLLPFLALTPWLESYLAHVAAFRVLADVRARVYAAFERLAPGYLLQRRSGDLGSAAISDVEQLELWFAHTLSPLTSAATVPVAALSALAVFHPALAAALAPALILLALLPAWLRKRAAAQGVKLRAELGEFNAEAVDTLQGLRELLTSGAGARQLDRLGDQNQRLLEAKLAHGRRSGLEHAVTNAATTLGMLAVLVTAALLTSAGSLQPALFPVAVILAATTFAPVIAVTDVARDLNLVIAAGDRIMTILNTPAPVTDRVTTPPPGPVEAHVGFEADPFPLRPRPARSARRRLLRHRPRRDRRPGRPFGSGQIHLRQPAHAHVGRHRRPDHRRRPRHPRLPPDDLRRLITLVPQDVYLFNISLRDNIRLGRPEATDDEVEAAARAAHAHEFVTGLPDGYDTLPGELGARLSGGQRQRIAIARALLKDAPILIMLDEAVSNLDAESEQEVTAAMTSRPPRPHHPGHRPPPVHHPHRRPRHRPGRRPGRRSRHARRTPPHPRRTHTTPRHPAHRLITSGIARRSGDGVAERSPWRSVCLPGERRRHLRVSGALQRPGRG